MKMKKEIIATEKAPKAIGPYSQGVKIGNLVFASGQLPIVPGKEGFPEGIEAQTEQSLKNAAAVLEAAGTGLENAVKVTVFLADINDFAKMNMVYANFFVSDPPARSAVEVANLPKNAMVEIEVIAAVLK